MTTEQTFLLGVLDHVTKFFAESGVPLSAAQLAAIEDVRDEVNPPSDDICGSRGPRIGDEGTPICKLTPGHEGLHAPDPEDGWERGMSWGLRMADGSYL